MLHGDGQYLPAKLPDFIDGFEDKILMQFLDLE